MSPVAKPLDVVWCDVVCKLSDVMCKLSVVYNTSSNAVLKGEGDGCRHRWYPDGL